MASSPLKHKPTFHARFNSLPSNPHPLVQQIDEQPRATTEACNCSSKLSGLKDLYDSVAALLQLPQTQQALAQEYFRKLVNEVIDWSLKLLETSGTAKDALSVAKESVHELQSALRRRRRGDEFGLSNEVNKYLTSRREVKKVIRNILRESKMKNSSSIVKEMSVHDSIRILREVQEATQSVLEAVLVNVSGPSKGSKWSLVSNLVLSKGEAKAEELNEFEKVDASVCAILGVYQKSMNFFHVKNELEKLLSSIQEFEDGLEWLIWCLIRSRVSLLNILSQ
ncbi:hypothetical protein HS088_TW07G01395 [Tripterygium wilfordii]|uniref:DUF241 domain protein n=1 Tax=Tripterygium wilfordii TaxID=458696 RepID=A0A7J7DHH5_TRIWF|nr:hypothetical protein HS088_TW07G01395 [Tripterygium wilfordii]